MHTGAPPETTAAHRPDTLVARFINRASGDPARVAYVTYPMGGLHALASLTWGEWITRSRAASGAFLAQHAEAGHRVAIYADNRELWPVAAMGIAMTGMVMVSIPPNGSADAVQAQLANSDVRFVVVDTLARFKMLRALVGGLSRPITIICDDLEPLRSSVAEGVYEWETWCRYGAQALHDYPVLRDRLTERLDALRPESAATITYVPECSVGIVRTLETRLADATLLATALSVTDTDRVVCAQSFSQPFESLLGIDVQIVSGSAVALVEHVSDAFRAARHFDATILAASSNETAQLRDGIATANRSGEYLRDTICEYVGRHCRLIVTAEETCLASFQRDLQRGGVALATVYGSEWQTCICMNGPTRFEDAAIGVAFENVGVRISEHAELQVRRSSHTAAGSYQRSDDADAAFSSDGAWHCTGQRVERAMSGSFRVVGHMRDMLEFATGRLIAPHAIEASLAALPLVAHAVCEADGLNSLVAVLSLDRHRVEAWTMARGVVAPWEALVEHPLVYEELARGVAQVNATLDASDRITAFTPTDLEFSVHTGELDDAGAVVRPVMASRFRHVFAELHQRGRV